MTATEPAIDPARVEADLLAFLAERTKASVAADQDLFATGLVSSMFAMQLVVHLEDTYDIEIVGPELTLDNFRTAQAMAALVQRLSTGGGDDG